MVDLHGYVIGDKLKTSLDFSKLSLIFKVTEGLKYVKFSLKRRYLVSHVLDSYQPCIDKSLQCFGDLDPIIIKVKSQLTSVIFSPKNF